MQALSRSIGQCSAGTDTVHVAVDQHAVPVDTTKSPVSPHTLTLGWKCSQMPSLVRSEPMLADVGGAKFALGHPLGASVSLMRFFFFKWSKEEKLY